MWVAQTSSTRIYISTQGCKGARGSGGKEHVRSGAGEEEYAAFCAGCEASERNGTRHLRLPCCTV